LNLAHLEPIDCLLPNLQIFLACVISGIDLFFTASSVGGVHKFRKPICRWDLNKSTHFRGWDFGVFTQVCTSRDAHRLPIRCARHGIDVSGTQNNLRLSSRMVIGPSFTSSTCIILRKLPVSTLLISLRAEATKYS